MSSYIVPSSQILMWSSIKVAASLQWLKLYVMEYEEVVCDVSPPGIQALLQLVKQVL